MDRGGNLSQRRGGREGRQWKERRRVVKVARCRNKYLKIEYRECSQYYVQKFQLQLFNVKEVHLIQINLFKTFNLCVLSTEADLCRFLPYFSIVMNITKINSDYANRSAIFTTYNLVTFGRTLQNILITFLRRRACSHRDTKRFVPQYSSSTSHHLYLPHLSLYLPHHLFY